VHQSTTPKERVSEALSYSRWGEVKCFMLTSFTPNSLLSCILIILFHQVDGMEYDVWMWGKNRCFNWPSACTVLRTFECEFL